MLQPFSRTGSPSGARNWLFPFSYNWLIHFLLKTKTSTSLITITSKRGRNMCAEFPQGATCWRAHLLWRAVIFWERGTCTAGAGGNGSWWGLNNKQILLGRIDTWCLLNILWAFRALSIIQNLVIFLRPTSHLWKFKEVKPIWQERPDARVLQVCVFRPSYSNTK